MKISALFIIIVFFFACKQQSKLNNTDIPSVYETLDTILFNEKHNQFPGHGNRPSDELFTEIALSFLGRPYTAKTLEKGEEELLVVNLREFDCTTLIETALAITYTVKENQGNFNDFQKALCKIRYRQGSLNGYTNRLHYFTDWITDNIEKGFISDVTQQYGGIEYPNTVDFMSTHTYAYEQLKNDSSLIEKIKDIELEISQRTYYYIPKEIIPEIKNELPSGLIVAFTTNIKGLDIIHTGITYKENGIVKLLHASSDGGKVLISDKSLSGYIDDNKLQTGILLLRIRP